MVTVPQVGYFWLMLTGRAGKGATAENRVASGKQPRPHIAAPSVLRFLPEVLDERPERAYLFLQLLDAAFEPFGSRQGNGPGDQDHRILEEGRQVLLDRGLGLFEEDP